MSVIRISFWIRDRSITINRMEVNKYIIR